MIKIIIADDHTEVRKAWALFLAGQKNIEVIALCADGEEVIEVVPTHQPDIILMDINMKHTSGIVATQHITSKYPAVKVIGVSFQNSPVYIKKMMDAGAKGYIVKHNVADELINAINEVYNGHTYLDKEARLALKK